MVDPGEIYKIEIGVNRYTPDMQKCLFPGYLINLSEINKICDHCIVVHTRGILWANSHIIVKNYAL
jgi:hypothetical protein